MIDPGCARALQAVVRAQKQSNSQPWRLFHACSPSWLNQSCAKAAREGVFTQPRPVATFRADQAFADRGHRRALAGRLSIAGIIDWTQFRWKRFVPPTILASPAATRTNEAIDALVRPLAMLPADLSITPMRREEADVLVGWAADEGWNPGKWDIGIAWNTDPEAFIALRKGSDLIGGGTIISYDRLFGFMGLFIVRRDQRGRGFGGDLWRYRLRRLRDRLAPGASIGMDGVLAMKPFYERGGFVFAHNDVRYQGKADGTMDPAARPIDSSTFAIVERFDRSYVPAPRASFLRRWIFQRDSHAIELRENDQIVGYGVARPAQTGYKLGPVFAKRADVAERLLLSLMARIPGEQVQLDVPEPNQSGKRLAEKFGLKEVFGCARLYHGTPPDLPIGDIFGVTSFEFG